MPIADLAALINAPATNTASRQQNNINTFNGLAAAYVYLGFGVPTISGFTNLINNVNNTNFGAGASGAVFNQENIDINTFVSLYRFNADAQNTFNAIIGNATSLVDALTRVYNSMVPTTAQNDAGRNFFLGSANFYLARASELGLSGIFGAAIVGAGALANILITNDVGGLGDSINDLRQAVIDGSAAIPENGGFTAVETADGTKFDADDGAAGGTIPITAGVTNYQGGVGNDQFTGAFSSITAPTTFNGGPGNDGVKLTGSGSISARFLQVERVEVTAQGGSASIDMSGSSIQEPGRKMTVASTNSVNDVAFRGLGERVDLEIRNQSAGGVTLSYTISSVEPQSVVIENFGTTDAIASALTAGGVASAPATIAGALTLDGVTVASITALGTNNFASLIGSSLTNVNVSGTGSLRIDTALSASIQSFDASASAGGIVVGLAAGGNVSVRTGSGSDRVSFGSGLTTQDFADLGGSIDTVVLANTDLTSSSDQTLAALNSVVKNVEIIELNGASAAINGSLMNNSAVSTIVFQTAGADTISNPNLGLTYRFGNANTGSVTFSGAASLAGTADSVNIVLQGVSKTTTSAFDGTTIDGLTTVGIETVSIVATGSDNTPIDWRTGFGPPTHELGVVNNSTNSTFALSGEGNVRGIGFTNVVKIDASVLTGALNLTLSPGADTITAGSGLQYIRGGGGIDTIDLTRATRGGDVVDLSTNTFTALDRDYVTGFQVGDYVRLSLATSAPTPLGSSAQMQTVTSLGGVDYNTSANDILELSFNIAGNALGSATDGSAVLAAVGSIAVTPGSLVGYIVAYQSNTAYIYYATEDPVDSGTALSASDIRLIGVLNNVAAGALEPSNFYF